jgi:hypothetical protein
MMLELKAIWDHDFFKTPAGIALIGEIRRKYAVFSANALSKPELIASPEELLKNDPPDSFIIIDDLLLFCQATVDFACLFHFGVAGLSASSSVYQASKD